MACYPAYYGTAQYGYSYYGTIFQELYSDSVIKTVNTYSESINSDAYILTITKTILVSPANDSTNIAEVEFVWEIPTNTASKNIHTRIEIDTVNTFDSANLIVKNSHIDSDFEYDNGGQDINPVKQVIKTSFIQAINLQTDSIFGGV